MNKRKLAAWAVILNTSMAMAGGILTNTNQSAHFARSIAREASTEIDAVYTNPAGTIKLSEGFHFSFTNQSAFQTRTITSTYAPFQGLGGNATKEFEGKASAPIIPNLMGVYRVGDWALSGSIAVCGGGGKATFNNGLPSFESMVAIATNVLSMQNSAVGGYELNTYMRGSSYIYGAQLGGAYKINDMFSAYGGFRLNIVNNGYEGYLRDVKVGVNGVMVPVENLIPQDNALYALVSEKALDCSQSGWGVAPILGLNFSYDNLNIGVKYEFKTNLNVENKTKYDNTGMFGDGVNTPHDIPSLLSIGASYKFFDALTINAGYHHFYDRRAKMDGNKHKSLTSGTNEYLGGVEYQINRLFLVSGGFQITRYGMSDNYQKDLSFSCDSYSIGFGGAVNVSPRVRINIGYFWTTYDDWSKEIADYGGFSVMTGGLIPAVPGKDVFSRTNKVFAAGVDFSF